MRQRVKVLSVFNLVYIAVVIYLITGYQHIQTSSAASQTDAGLLVFGAGAGLFALILVGLIPCLVGFYAVFKEIGARSLATSEEKLLAIPLVLGGIFGLIVPFLGWVAVPLFGIWGYRNGVAKAKKTRVA